MRPCRSQPDDARHPHAGQRADRHVHARRDAERVHHSDFESAKDKVLLGAERKSMIMSEEDKRITAYHEAGHALVAMLTPGSDPVHKVTIIPRGLSLGVTQTLPTGDRLNYTDTQIYAIIRYAMGGRAAEHIVEERRKGQL